MAQLTLHHLENSRSQRILWLFEELGLDYEMKSYPRTAAGRSPKELYAIHPLGRSPIVTHGDRVLVESAVVVEYVLDHFGEGRLRPEPGTDAYEDYRLFLHFAEGSMMAPLLVKLITGRLKGAIPLLGKAVAGKIDGSYTDPQIRGQLDFVEGALEGREWLAGELSGADVMMCFPVLAALSRAGDTSGLPNLHAYAERVRARPAFARALEKGGPLDL